MHFSVAVIILMEIDTVVNVQPCASHISKEFPEVGG